MLIALTYLLTSVYLNPKWACFAAVFNKHPPGTLRSGSIIVGDVIKCDENTTVDDDVKDQFPDNDVTQSAECADQTSQRDDKHQPVAIHPTCIARTPEVDRHGDKMALPEVSSLGDRELAAVSPPSHENVFSPRTCSIVPRSTRLPRRRVGPLPPHQHVPPYNLLTSAVRPPCSDRAPRLLRNVPPPPPPPPPLPGHVMRLFATSSKSTCTRPNAPVASTAGRPVRFPRMGHTGLATNSAASQRMTLHVVRPDHLQLWVSDQLDAPAGLLTFSAGEIAISHRRCNTSVDVSNVLTQKSLLEEVMMFVRSTRHH